ncbi:DNA topoisomerase VI subunit B [Candidatus Woesearchaeota archaeon]|nr:DNA topoisomerase VI subunit B [Candidatus Woesearchaeota archaeon]
MAPNRQLTEFNKNTGTKAEEMATKQRDIGVAEFFARNRHLLGFDNPRKALLTTIKEAVDNSLDACEEASIFPEIYIEAIEISPSRFKVIVEDNGPGIVKAQIPKIFGKLLYGSKFHKLSQSRGQQGIGISASVMYGQLTTGKSAKIISKIGANKPAHYYELHLDTKTNKPEILKDDITEWKKDHGTKIELDLEASYLKGAQSVDEYIKETAIANPHATFIYTNPKAEQIIFPKVVEKFPQQPKEITPHPYGVELGVLQAMAKDTQTKTLYQFLTTEFSRVSSKVAKEICENARLSEKIKPKNLARQDIEKLMKGIQETKIMAPPTDCLSPIGAEQLEKGVRKEVNAEFYASVSRPPAVYRGNPFLVEAAVAYGGNQPGDKSARIIRFANRVPLLYQQGACGVTKSIVETGWRNYGLSQSQNSLPIAPLTIVVHIASVWVPFTSESKEAIAHYPEIIKEIKLALQEVGRQLVRYVGKKKRVHAELKKRSYIEKYIPHVAEALQELLEYSDNEKKATEKLLVELLEKHRGELEDISFDEEKNKDYDEEFANIGKEEEEENNEQES